MYTHGVSLTSDDLADIKQLMEATVAAAFTVQNERLERRFDAIDERFDGIDSRLDSIDSRFDGMDVKLDTIADAARVQFNEQEERLDNHETRIIRLEEKAA